MVLPQLMAALAVALVPLKVTIVEDANFSAIPEARVEHILASAQTAYASYLEPSAVQFAISRRMTPEAYFASLDPSAMRECLARFTSGRAESPVDYDRASLPATVASFLSRWPLATLRRAFPGEVRTYDQAARTLIAEMRRNAVAAQDNGLLTGQKGQRFSDWLCAMEVQRDDDVVLANSYVFYDLATEPYPHTVFHHSRLSGAAMFSGAREPMFGRAVFVSTYSEEPVSDAFIGTYLLAHELGHAILKIPDVYDHGRGCLMNTSFTPSYAQSYAALPHSPRPQTEWFCAKCHAYRESHAAVNEMQAAIARSDWPLAERRLERAVVQLPAFADGDASAYKSRLYVRVAAGELAANRLRQAELFAYHATTLDPSSDEARALLRRVRSRLASPASR